MKKTLFGQFWPVDRIGLRWKLKSPQMTSLPLVIIIESKKVAKSSVNIVVVSKFLEDGVVVGKNQIQSQ